MERTRCRLSIIRNAPKASSENLVLDLSTRFFSSGIWGDRWSEFFKATYCPWPKPKALNVSSSIWPDALKPRWAWKALSALSVPGPTLPSIGP